MDGAVVDHADDGHAQVAPDAEGDAEAEAAQHGDDVPAGEAEAGAVAQGGLPLLSGRGSPILRQLDGLTCLLPPLQPPAPQSPSFIPASSSHQVEVNLDTWTPPPPPFLPPLYARVCTGLHHPSIPPSLHPSILIFFFRPPQASIDSRTLFVPVAAENIWNPAKSRQKPP